MSGLPASLERVFTMLRQTHAGCGECLGPPALPKRKLQECVQRHWWAHFGAGNLQWATARGEFTRAHTGAVSGRWPCFRPLPRTPADSNGRQVSTIQGTQETAGYHPEEGREGRRGSKGGSTIDQGAQALSGRARHGRRVTPDGSWRVAVYVARLWCVGGPCLTNCVQARIAQQASLVPRIHPEACSGVRKVVEAAGDGAA